MKTQPADENGKVYLKCEHCGGGVTLTTKPVPAVILPTLVCPECRKDASGDVIPVLPHSLPE